MSSLSGRVLHATGIFMLSSISYVTVKTGLIKYASKLKVVIQSCNPSTQETEAEGSA